MTVLVGVRCKDGVVIGADSAATFTSAQQLATIGQQPVKKIAIIEGKIIVAGTGEIGLGQRFCDTVQQGWGKKHFFQNKVEATRRVAADATNDFAATHVNRGTYGALVAFPSAKQAELCEFAVSNFQPELKTEDLWYVSMGSGQSIADPCLGFVRQAFWADGAPSCNDGVFAVVWTLVQAIRLNPGGICAPMQVATLTYTGKDPVARMLEPDEIAEHEANVDGAIEHLRQYPKKVAGAAAETIPQLAAQAAPQGGGTNS
jgi:hypothetical protein